MSKQYVTWESCEEYVKSVCNYFKDEIIKHQIDGWDCYAPPRGGLIFQVLLSHCVGKYNSKINFVSGPTEGCLIIDDIADTGKTIDNALIAYNLKREDVTITCMFWHPQSTIKPDFFSFVKGDDWVVYPYEKIGEASGAVFG